MAARVGSSGCGFGELVAGATSWFGLKIASFVDARVGDPGTARARRAAESLEVCVEPTASYFFGPRAAPHRLHRAGAKMSTTLTIMRWYGGMFRAWSRGWELE